MPNIILIFDSNWCREKEEAVRVTKLKYGFINSLEILGLLKFSCGNSLTLSCEFMNVADVRVDTGDKADWAAL